MKITNLKITGFRSLKDVDWHPGDLNIVIGPNASGKSNFLDLFEMLFSLPRRGLADYVQSRGGIDSLLWDGEAERITIVLDLDGTTGFRPNNQARFRYSMSVAPSGPLGSFKVLGESLMSPETGLEFITSAQGSPGNGLPERPGEPEESFLSFRRKRRFSEMLEQPDIGTEMASWRVHQIIDTSPGSTVRKAPVTRHGTQVENDGSNLINVLHTLYTGDRKSAERIDAAMGAAFDHFVELVFPPSPAADRCVQMKVRWKGLKRDCPLSDLSDGTLRFLYLISILANPNPPSIIAIDEPETGLHPKMMGIVADYAMEAARHTQVVLTTHSAEFLDAFNEEPPTVTVAELVDGATKLTVKSGDDLAYWLKEYTLGALFRSGELEHTE